MANSFVARLQAALNTEKQHGTFRIFLKRVGSYYYYYYYYSAAEDGGGIQFRPFSALEWNNRRPIQRRASFALC